MVREIRDGNFETDWDGMIWDGTFMIIVDDFTLLRAIKIAEGEGEGWFHSSPPKGAKTYGTSTIYDHVISRPSFEIIKSNDYLRALLKDFLQKNIQVAVQKEKVASERKKFFVIRWLFKNVIRDLEDELTTLEASRDEAFKKFEMLRKLTDMKNQMLIRLPS
jgi:hypothetical protein